MAVQPTSFESSAAATPESVNTADEIAQHMGYSSIGELEAAQQFGPLSAIEMEVHENNALLAASEDNYPFISQFGPDDADAGVGLFFDPSNANQFESYDMSEFIDFNEGSYGFEQQL
jgi:hypothetical protein